MFPGQNRHRIGTNLVGDIAVGSDAIRTDHDRVDLAFFHHGAGHAVGDHSRGNAILHQFPCRQSRSLEERACLIGIYVNLLSLFHRSPDHAQGSAVSAGSQSPRVTVGEYASTGGHQACTVPPHNLIRGDVFGVHALGLFDQSLLDLG